MASFLVVCRRIDRSVLGLCIAQAITFAACAVVDSEYAAIGLFLTPTLIAGLVIFAFQFAYYADLADHGEPHKAAPSQLGRAPTSEDVEPRSPAGE